SDTTGTLTVSRGGTGATTYSYGLLLSPGGTTALTNIATSSLGLLTTDVAEGTNLYYTTTRFDNRLSATTTLPNLTTLANVVTVGALNAGSITSGFGTINTGDDAITTTGLGTFGTLLLTGSSTLQNFTFVNATGTSATTTNFFATTASSTNLFSTNFTTGAITSGLVNGQTISSAANFTGTLTVTGGLTTLGNASTTQIGSTGSAYFATSGGNVGIGTTSPGQKLSVAGDILGNNFIGSYFTATSTSATSTFTGLSATNVSANNFMTTSGTFQFTALNTAGTLNITAQQANQSAILSATAPNGKIFTFMSQNATATIMTQPSVNLVFATDDTERMRVMNTSGNLGIGTTSPGQKLSVAGDILGNAIIGSYFTATSTTASTFAGAITSSGTVTGTNLVASSASATSTLAGGLAIETSGLVYDYSTNNVGIGTASPSAVLHSISTAEPLRLGYNSANYVKFVVDAAGNLAITPTDGVSNQAASFAGALSIGSTLNVTGDVRMAGGQQFYLDAATNSVALNSTSNGLNTVAGGATRLTLTSGGNYGIGTTSPGQKLSVAGDIL
ncbi:MAG: hypothetical protein AAB447_00315, partial [Patescibacteria group bacterium]